MFAEPSFAIMFPAILFGVFFIAALFVVSLRLPPCPQCGTPAPMFRKPASWRQLMWGGWTCSECGLELDVSGRPVEGQAPDKWAVLRAIEEIDEREHRLHSQDERNRNANDQTKRGDAS